MAITLTVIKAEKAVEIRRHGFFGKAMLPYSELEDGGIVKKLEDLERRFTVREQLAEIPYLEKEADCVTDQKILAAIDFSAYPDAVMKHAAGLAESLKSQSIIANVINQRDITAMRTVIQNRVDINVDSA